MDDLIRRQDAIDEVKEIYEWHDNVTKERIIEHFKQLPSAQADSKELSGTHKALDTVSRQAVIEAINKIFPADPMRDDYTQGITCGAALANIYVAQLPSAHPETHEERTETHACDCIERQAAINEIKEIYEWHDNVTKERIIEHFKRLPSVQPEQPSREYVEQIKWERDLAIQQLKDLGYGLGEKPRTQDYKTDHGYMWLCPKCGLPVHSDFEKCVRCGYER